MHASDNLFERADQALVATAPEDKAAAVRALVVDWRAGRVAPAHGVSGPAPIGEPGRPQRPHLVPPRELPRRRLNTLEGQAALIHALAHIEFNAINLALDAVYRFRDLPLAFYGDWLRVAEEEASHFELLRAHLCELGHDYGDFPAHDGLWEMARQTAHDALVRMALVPRVLEARGLDVTPDMMRRLRAAGNAAAADILVIILRDEVGHVAIGSRWFEYLCRARGLEPRATFRNLLQTYMKGGIKGPFHREARLRAGFTEAELAELEAMT